MTSDPPAPVAPERATGPRARPFHQRGRKATTVYWIIAIYTFLIWAYGALTAVFKLSRLKDQLIGGVAISRIDTSAAIAFVVSSLFFFAANFSQSRRMSTPFRDRVLAGILRVAVYYGFSGWLYIVGNSLVHPETLHQQLTHLSSVPTESQFGMSCFVASAVAALALSLAGWPLLGPKGSQPPGGNRT
jgi:hypothetical protein